MASARRPHLDNSLDYCFKIVIVGDYKVGKTSLLCRYTDKTFDSSIKTTAYVDFCAKNLVRKKKRIKLQIWDTAGHERFRTAVASYYRGAMGVILVYDITNRSSFQNIGFWHNEMKKYCETDTQAILVGNNSHRTREREVQAEEGQQLATVLEVPFLETSPKENINVDECFNELVDCILRGIERGQYKQALTALVLPASGTEQSNKEVVACSC